MKFPSNCMTPANVHGLEEGSTTSIFTKKERNKRRKRIVFPKEGDKILESKLITTKNKTKEDNNKQKIIIRAQ